MKYLTAPILTMLVAGISAPATTQMTSDTYARAERFMGRNARTLVYGAEVNPQWINGQSSFWFRNRSSDGFEFVRVNAATGDRRRAFDHARLAAALSLAADTSYVPFDLPFETFEFDDTETAIRFVIADSAQWRCDVERYVCVGPEVSSRLPVDEVPSPDGTLIAFLRDENLWVRHRDTGSEEQLSHDGTMHYGYGVLPENRDEVTHRRRNIKRRPVLAWSPDSRKIITHRLDERGVREVHHLETELFSAKLYTSRYALPGDSIVPTYELHVFDVTTGEGVRIDMPPQEMVNTTCCGLMQDSVWKDVQWSQNSQHVFFTHLKRGYKELDLYVADPNTGGVRRVLRETSPTFIELNVNSSTVPNWRVSVDGSELIWFSQRDGWGHLYRYDVANGNILNRLTAGAWVVYDIVYFDDESRQVFFTAVGRDVGSDRYLRKLYRVNWDGSDLTLLTNEDADHNITVSPDGEYFVDTYSRRDMLPITVVRNRNGAIVGEVERANADLLMETAWTWPVPYTAKARDGVTDLSGYLYFPSTFDPDASYPVLDYIYPGPQVGPIGYRSFTASPRGDAHAMAELGFIVFTIDATGTPGRSKAFHDAYYARMEDNGIPDHIAALKQLAQRYPQMDLDRVGIYGHSGGGLSSTGAILRYPDFFKVAVSGAGNHDNRSFGHYWGEKYHGLLTRTDEGGDNYDSQANHLIAKNLQGKLLLSYGTLDDRVHPNATLLLIDALIEHNKDFDLIVMPNRNHGYSQESYIVRRTWDYFVEHLLGLEPPSAYRLGSD